VNTGWAGLDDGKVVSINITDGSVSTSFTTGGAVVTAPLLDAYPGTNSNNLYVTSTDGTLYSRTAANLTVTPSGWTDFVTGSSIYSSPFMTYNTSGSKYIFFGADNGKLYKLDSVSGALQWSFQAGGAIRSSPVWIAGNCGTISLASDYVYFGSDDGYIYGLDAATGALRSGFPVATGGAVRADMIADCDRRTLTVGSNDGKTYTLNIGQ
jgi:outer membrane protein assembly factor BamB